ncbi:interleukin-1 receptor accessory protein-like [Pelmatolapia mariae]|uniref:interleukin-1 receptor accessory protein-like n=1 Tax=Pelmatolapia mariae TaxID=158779 RepID=UPI002FE6337E
MNGKISLLLLFLVFLTSTPGVCPLSFQEVNAKAGEMAVLQCPSYRGYSDGDAEVFWTSHTVDEMKLFNMSISAEQRQMGVLVHGRILVILRASVNHQGNYSCSFRNSSRRSWISLEVYKAQSRDSEQMNQISKECYTEEYCNLYCPEKNVRFNTLNITRIGITWHKEGGSSPKDGYFPSVKKEDSGNYTCTRSYLYDGQIYNMTSTVKLDVQPSKITEKAVIISPKNKQVFEVDLGSRVVIDCKAVMMSDTDDLFWLSGSSFVDADTSLSVFYNDTGFNSREEIHMTSLIFRKVSEDDLSKNYTCKLQSDYQTSFVTITLKQKEITEKAVITSPENKQVFEVDLGSTVLVDCKAVMMSDTDDLFWLSGDSFVNADTSLPVFYNDTRVNSTEEINMTTSLIFRKVSEDNLSKKYTCKLQSDYQTNFVTITLKQKAASSSYFEALWIVGFVLMVMVLTAVIYAKFKVDITLFLRQILGCHRTIPDGKSYNACLMYYKSSTDPGLNEDDRKRLESEMKHRFGYSLCLYSPDVVPDKGEAVLDCIRQSQTVVLVPCSEDSGSGVDLLNSIQASLKKLQTHVVLIKTETAGVLSTSSSSEALKLCKAADCVTWKGKSSMLPSSAFWKLLRYYLPAPQRAPRALT